MIIIFTIMTWIEMLIIVWSPMSHIMWASMVCHFSVVMPGTVKQFVEVEWENKLVRVLFLSRSLSSLR